VVLKEGKSKESDKMTTNDLKVQISSRNDVMSGDGMKAQVRLSSSQVWLKPIASALQ